MADVSRRKMLLSGGTLGALGALSPVSRSRRRVPNVAETPGSAARIW